MRLIPIAALAGALMAAHASPALGDVMLKDGRFIAMGHPGEHATEFEGVPYRFVGEPFRAHLLLLVFDAEGSIYALEDQLSLRGYQASRLHLMLASAWDWFVPTDTRVATLDVHYVDGSRDSFDLVQGVSVCSWTVPGPDDPPMAQVPLKPAYTWFPIVNPVAPTGRQDLQGNYYHAAFDLQRKPLDRIEMQMPEDFQSAVSNGAYTARRHYISVGAVTLDTAERRQGGERLP
jgi:hypothetical protein